MNVTISIWNISFSIGSIIYNIIRRIEKASGTAFFSENAIIGKVIEQLYPKPKKDIFDILEGFILHHLGGIFESMIGLIPLLERGMVQLEVSRGQPAFRLDVKNKLVKDI